LIEYLENRNNKLEVWKGYILAGAMFLTSIMQSFLLQYYLHHCYLVGMKLKTALLGLIYDKVSEGKQAGRQEGIKARRKEERRKAGEKEGGTNGSRGEGARGGGGRD